MRSRSLATLGRPCLLVALSMAVACSGTPPVGPVPVQGAWEGTVLGIPFEMEMVVVSRSRSVHSIEGTAWLLVDESAAPLQLELLGTNWAHEADHLDFSVSGVEGPIAPYGRFDGRVNADGSLSGTFTMPPLGDPEGSPFLGHWPQGATVVSVTFTRR